MNKRFTFDFKFFDYFEGMCFIISETGKILTSNKACIKKLQVNLNKINFFEIIANSEKVLVKNAISSCLQKQKSLNLPTKFKIDDQQMCVEMFISHYKSTEDGTTIENNCFIIALDVTDKKEREEELQRFFYVAENTVNPVQITDTEGNMIYVNPAFLKVSGYTKEELIGKNPNIFGSKKQKKRFWSEMWTTIKSGKVWIGDGENKMKSGEPFYTQLLISPILDGEQKVTGYFGVHRDISEIKTMEKQLIHTQKMESIGTLAAGIAHEVGNPLASISALVQVAQRSTEDAFIKEKLNLVKSQVIRISKIIRDLVDFSRPSTFELQRVNINACLKEAVEITKVGTKAKTIEFNVKLSDDIPNLPLVADQLEQVFVNILLNAVDAINEVKDEKKEKRISIESSLSKDEAIITFTDTGSGISEGNLTKIFEPFFTTTSSGTGTGLGLWVSYGIIKSFQGNLEVQSNTGLGTTFTIKLP